jgi:Skp family chaperone for outer membrane proteins
VLDVTKSQRVAASAVLFVLAVLACSMALGQQRPGVGGMSMQPPGGIAFLDITKVFKNHARFNELMAELKGDETKAEAAMKGEVDYVNKMMEDLKGIKAGTEEYSMREQEIARRRADMNVRIQLQRREFLVREAKIYNQVYQEVAKEVEMFAAANGISTVIRVTGDPVDPNNPQEVLTNINKPVIFFNRNLDITGAILDRLNRDAGRPAGQDPRNATRPIGVPGPGSGLR